MQSTSISGSNPYGQQQAGNPSENQQNPSQTTFSMYDLPNMMISAICTILFGSVNPLCGEDSSGEQAIDRKNSDSLNFSQFPMVTQHAIRSSQIKNLKDPVLLELYCLPDMMIANIVGRQCKCDVQFKFCKNWTRCIKEISTENLWNSNTSCITCITAVEMFPQVEARIRLAQLGGPLKQSPAIQTLEAKWERVKMEARNATIDKLLPLPEILNQDEILSPFICQLSKRVSIIPVRDKCGHLFDYIVLSRYICSNKKSNQKATCPVEPQSKLKYKNITFDLSAFITIHRRLAALEKEGLISRATPYDSLGKPQVQDDRPVIFELADLNQE